MTINLNDLPEPRPGKYRNPPRPKDDLKGLQLPPRYQIQAASATRRTPDGKDVPVKAKPIPKSLKRRGYGQ